MAVCLSLACLVVAGGGWLGFNFGGSGSGQPEARGELVVSTQKPGVRFVRQLTLAPAFADAGGILLCYQAAQGGSLRVVLDSKQSALYRQAADGKTEKLAASAWTPKPGDRIEIFREYDWLTLACNGKVLAVAACPEGEWTQESWQALAKGAAAPVADPVYQKTAPVFFDDDFMHEDGALGGWKALSGKWDIEIVMEKAGGSAGRSINAFSFSGSGPGAAAVTGEWFWSHYRLSLSCMPGEKTGVGCFVCYQDPANTYRVSWKDDVLVLLKVSGGTETVLGKVPSLPCRPGSWSRLEVETNQGLLTVCIDGQALIQAIDPQPLWGGKIGLWSDGEKATVFDDVQVRSVTSAEWTADRGLPLPAFLGPAGANDVQLRGVSLLNAQVSVRTAALPEAGMRLVLRRQANGDALVGEVKKDGIAIRLRQNQEEKDLARVAVTQPPSGCLSFHVFNDQAWICQDDRMLCSTTGAAALGRGGLGASGVATAGSLDFGEEAPLPEIACRVPVFEREVQGQMDNWATQEGEWLQEKRGTRQIWRHRSDFWQDFEATVRLADLPEQAQEYGLVVFDPEQADPAGDVSLCVVPAKDKVPAKLQLSRGATVLETLSLPEKVQQITLARRNSRLLVKVDGQVRANVALPQGLESLCAIGRIGEGSFRKWALAVDISAAAVRTYSFRESPADWRIAGGTWAVTNRWQCDPRWSFFSAENLSGPACLWSKLEHGQNFTLEFFAAPKMRNGNNPGMGYAAIADFNATFGADGQDLSSGVSVLYGGLKDTGSFFYQGKTLFASSTAPEACIPKGSSIHHLWFHAKIRKRGQNLTFWANDKLVLQAPIPAGAGKGSRFALWTWNNAFMLSQVRISNDAPWKASADILTPSKTIPETPYAAAP